MSLIGSSWQRAAAADKFWKDPNQRRADKDLSGLPV
jgi:hypothetical protein